MDSKNRTLPYTVLAPYYDYMLQHVDYHSWYRFITSVMIATINNPRTILELGTGTGRFGSKFSADDFTIFGIDRSMEMLRVARSRTFKNYRVICADIRQFAFNRTFDFIFSVHDTLNYLLTEEDLLAMFASVSKVMDKKSVFLFDITTEYNITSNFAGQEHRYSTRGTEITWKNSFDSEQYLVISDLTFNQDGTRFHEQHYQKIHTVPFMERIIKQAGFQLTALYGDYEMKEPKDDTVMINFVTRLA